MSPKIVVSLTSIPPRFPDLVPVLNSLLGQSPAPDAVELTIPRSYRRFPGHRFDLPPVPKGIDVHVSDVDYGPATKVLPCAQRYRGTNTRIIYCDDDRVAPKGWLKALVDASEHRPECAIASSGGDLEWISDSRQPRAQRQKGIDWSYHWARSKHLLGEVGAKEKSAKPGRRLFQSDGYVHIAEGLGGVLVRPEFFDEISFDIPPKIWAVDDYWLSGCLERQGIGVWIASACLRPAGWAHGPADALSCQTIEGLDRAAANQACIRFMQQTYGIWL